MATVPSPSSQTASAVVTSTLLNNHRDVGQFLLGSSMTGGGGRRPLFIGTLSVAQTLTTSVDAGLTLDAEVLDYDNSHSTVTNTTRYTGLTAGWYFAFCGIQFASNAAGLRQAGIGQNGAGPSAATSSAAPATGAAALMQASAIVQLNGTTDYIEARALQTSGGNLNVTFARLYVYWLSN